MKRVLFAGLAMLLVLSGIGSSFAAVTGDCVNCHTMHDSQDGASVTDDGVAVGGLLVSDCVGCHSSADSETIKVIGTSRIPIVYNQAAPSKPLAGGNFYWVAGAGFGDNYGHNVFGIVGQDGELDSAPGGIKGIYNQADCAVCHKSLQKGCESCHWPRHHAGGDQSPIAGQADGWYRFLGSAMYADVPSLGDPNTAEGVIGVEEINWEQDPSATVHNVYKGTASPYGDFDSGEPYENSIGSFCAGCHSKFHSEMIKAGWIRHPSDVVLPDDADREYSGYTTYNPLAPIAKQTLDGSVTDAVVPGEDVVTCLSCHRAHGSPNGDMLRWDYHGDCGAGQQNDNCGCFACHTAKDSL